MFLFQRNISPESRRSSALVSTTSPSSPPTRPRRSYSTAGSYQDSQSSRLPTSPDAGRKRNSLFTLRTRPRSRSGTASTKRSSFVSVSASNTERHSRRASREGVTSPGGRRSPSDHLRTMDQPAVSRPKKVKKRSRLTLTAGSIPQPNNMSVAPAGHYSMSEGLRRSEMPQSINRPSKRYCMHQSSS